MTAIDKAFARSEKWKPAPGASEEAVAQLKRRAEVELPTVYLYFLQRSNGGEGEFGVQPGWFQLWRAENILDYNRDYEVQDNLPGFLAFGSSGGGMLFVFDTRNGQPYPVLAVDTITLDLDECIFIGDEFSVFLSQIGEIWEDDA